MRKSFAAALLLALASPCFAADAADAADCGTFTWDMTHELALFGGAAKPLSSAVRASVAPQLEVGVLYTVELHPLAEVAFVHPLGKDMPAEASSGGVLKLHVKDAGKYRITLDAPLWIDVVSGNELVASTGFQGRQPCRLIHKSVEWSLPADADVVVQLAGPTRPRTNLAVTAAPTEDIH